MSKDNLEAKVKELEATVRELERDLIHDSLTGLKTRAFFEEEARVYFDVAINLSAAERSRRRQWFGFTNISFIFFDIDHFKKVNDTHGHPAGDMALKAVADTIRLSVREGDTVSRWGGEEIVATLIGATERDAVSKAEDVRRQVESIKFGKVPDLKITISAGVASAEQGRSFEDILKRADQALYKAKQTGRNKVMAYSAI